MDNTRTAYKVMKQDLQITGSRFWNISVNVYSAPDQIPRVENCFAIMFTNIGAVTARVSGMVIFPSATPGSALGDSRSISGHLLDLFKGNITLQLDAGAGAAVEIIQFFYLSEQQSK